MNKSIVYFSAVRDQSGYGMCSRNYVLGLDKLGVDIVLRNVGFWNGQPLIFSPEIESTFKRIESKPLPADKKWILIQHVTPDNYTFDERAYKNIGYTPFETDGLPAHWVLPMKALDNIFVASNFNRLTYSNSKYGIDKEKIKVIPHGVDINIFTPEGDKMQFRTNIEDKFKIGANFDWNPRKCPELLIEAYTQAFDKSDNTILILKTFFQTTEQHFVKIFGISTENYIIKTINDIREKCDKKENFPLIYIIRDIFDDICLPSFYRVMDCMCGLSRGEGFGLTLSESMSSELPVIATRWSGNLDFMNDNNSFLVDADIVRIPEDTWLNIISNNYKGRQCWAEPNIEQIINQMKYIYNNYDKAKEKAKQARQDMIKSYTWDIVCEKYKKILEEIEEE